MSNEQIERIRAEEALRIEIRKSLQEPPPTQPMKKSSLWVFLNSSFGLWLLSTIFITLIGAKYSEMQANHKEAQRQIEAKEAEKTKQATQDWLESKRKMDAFRRASIEVSQRYSTTLSRLYLLNQKPGPESKLASAGQIRIAFEPLSESPSNHKIASIYPEYGTFNILTLIVELQNNSERPGDSLALKRHLTNTNRILNRVAQQSDPADPKEFASALITAMRSSFWDNGFVFTACEPEKPFSC